MEVSRVVIPPEWHAHDAVWVGWPHLRGEWGAAFDGAREEIASFIGLLAAYVPVRVACGSEEAYQSASVVFSGSGDGIVLARIPSGDIWLRDTGPIFGRAGTSRLANTFLFNGWGGKYVMPGDIDTASAIAAFEQIEDRPHPFILEGGALETDGSGLLLTTRQCLLNENRNLTWANEASAERDLKTAFAFQRACWLEDGLANDHTDGHIDNLVRFIGPNRVVCQTASGEDDPNADLYAKTETALRAFGLDVSILPSPGRVEDDDGSVLPASHMNFVISNGIVILPAYEAEYSVAALSALSSLFPGRQVKTLPSRQIIRGGGSFHCMTCHIPTHNG